MNKQINKLAMKSNILLWSIFIMVIQFVIILPVFASVQEFIASKEHITANLGAAKQNRIEFEQGRILEIIGNSSQYSLITPPNAKYIFLTPKIAVGGVIDLSIIYGDNKVQELSLYVNSTFGQTIFIKQDKQSVKVSSTKPHDNIKELAEIIRSMAFGKRGKYDIELMKYPLSPLLGGAVSSNLILTFDLKYNFASSQLIGRRLRIKNNSNKPTKLIESNFEHIFENIVAINLSKETLKPKEEGFVYLISQVNK